MIKKLTDIEIRANILDVAKKMYEKGLVNAIEGNVSYRDNYKVYITPSGVCKDKLTGDMLVIVDMSGNVIGGNYKPSSELKMHLACYGLRDDIKSVIHTHSPYATAYSIANKPIVTKSYPEMIIAFEKIPVAKYGTPSTDEIHAGFSEIIYDYDVFLMEMHGIVSVNGDIFEAFDRIEAAEGIAKALTIANQIGGVSDLPQGELEKLSNLRKMQLAERKARLIKQKK